jgi:hypothetical protein
MLIAARPFYDRPTMRTRATTGWYWYWYWYATRRGGYQLVLDGGLCMRATDASEENEGNNIVRVWSK